MISDIRERAYIEEGKSLLGQTGKDLFMDRISKKMKKKKMKMNEKLKIGKIIHL